MPGSRAGRFVFTRKEENMKTPYFKLLTVAAIIVLLFSILPASAVRSVQAKSGPWNFHATLKPGISYSYYLGPADSGAVYVVDITPLTKSVDGAHIQSVVKPKYDGSVWNDVLEVLLPEPFPKQQVLITVYTLSGLETRMDGTDTLQPGVWQGYPIRPASETTGPYLADIDPLESSVKGATFERIYIHPEAPWGENMLWDILRVQTQPSLPGNVNARMRVYLAPSLSLVSDLYIALKKSDLWSGFIIGPSSMKRGYVVRAISLDPGPEIQPSDLNQYIIQPEFNGTVWNDVLRIQAGNQDANWEQVDYHFLIYACDKKSCP
jgi:hypothetical protein